MSDASRSGKLSRLTGRHFLTADLNTGFALLEAAKESCQAGEQSSALRQIDAAKDAMDDAYRLLAGLNDRDADEFVHRVQALECELEATYQLTRGAAAVGL
jgi:hypothetical protein